MNEWVYSTFIIVIILIAIVLENSLVLLIYKYFHLSLVQNISSIYDTYII